METESESKPPSGSPEPSDEPGDVPEQLREFGHFAIIKELGRGAQGVVYLAEDTKLHRKVALKMLAGSAAQSKSVRDRFQREAEITSLYLERSRKSCRLNLKTVAMKRPPRFWHTLERGIPR